MKVELNHLPAQSDYFNAEDDTVCFVGGLGCGKSKVAADDILRVASLYPKCGKGKNTPGIAIFSNTYAQLIDGTMGTFFEACDRWGIKYKDYILQKHKIYLIDLDCWIGVWSVDNPINYKSLELCYIWIDEAQAWDRNAYNLVIGRRRGTDQQRRLYPKMPLRTRITANPPHTLDHWLVDLCTKKGYNDMKPARLITASIWDNPFIPQSNIDMLMASYDPELAAIELGGKFGEIGKGRIWRMFNRGKHIWTEQQAIERGLPPLRYDPRIPLCWSHDFNIDPLCSVLFQWRRVNVDGFQKDVMYVLEEFQIRHSIISEAAKEFVTNHPEACEVARRSGLILYGDASGHQGNRQTGASDWSALRAELARHGHWGETRIPNANPPLEMRWVAGNNKLENSKGEIGVIIHDRCRELPIDLERMFYKPGTRLVEVPKVKDGKATKLITHLADAWSYPIAKEYPVLEARGAWPQTQR